MTAAIHALPAWVRGPLRSSAARPLRFAGTGSVAGAAQLLLLTLMTQGGWNAILANALAFLIAAQINFALSMTFTWSDRRSAGSLVGRWLLYHGSIALMALVNMLVFVFARSFLPTQAAALAGIGTAGLGNYLMGDRVVFRRPNESPTEGEVSRRVA